MRCCPPAGDSHALDKFDQLVQTCFSTFSGLHLEPGQWGQAARGLSHAGLGLRSARQHAAGAYLSSVGGCADLCGDLDRGYWLDHSGDIAAALSELNAALPPNQLLGAAAALAQSQKQLSNLVDEAGWALQLDGASAVQKATLHFSSSSWCQSFPHLCSQRPHQNGACRLPLRGECAAWCARSQSRCLVSKMGIILACVWLVGSVCS